MENLDIDGIMKAMADPKVGKNIDQIMQLMDDGNRVMDKVEKIVGTLDRCGMKAGLMRMAGMKMGVDVDTPLKCEQKGIIPTTSYHEIVYNQFNTLTEEQIASILVDGVQADEPKLVELDDGKDN
jgi:hypothetical protein